MLLGGCFFTADYAPHRRAGHENRRKSVVASGAGEGICDPMKKEYPVIAPGEVIECRVAPWYFNRRGLLALMFAAFGAYFWYDGKYGYPAANEKAARKEWFEKEVLTSFEQARKGGSIPQWEEDARKKGWPVGKNGEAPKWLTYSAEQGLPEKPKAYTEKEIEEQFWWGGAMFVCAALTGLFVLLNRGKVVRGFADKFVTPDGTEVPYANVFRLDKRRWSSKGLATAHFRDKPEAPEKTAKLDCLKFDEAGMESIMATLLANFSGELIEKVEEPDEDAEESGTSGDESKTASQEG